MLNQTKEAPFYDSFQVHKKKLNNFQLEDHLPGNRYYIWRNFVYNKSKSKTKSTFLLFVNIELFVIIIIMNIKPVKLVRVNKFLHIWNNNIQLVFNETIHVDDDGREWLWLMVFMVLYDAYLQHRAFLIQFYILFCFTEYHNYFVTFRPHFIHLFTIVLSTLRNKNKNNYQWKFLGRF